MLLALWHPPRKTVAGMVLLTTQMSVTIAASAVAYTVGAYGASTHAAVVLVAIATAILGPILFNRILGDPEEGPARQSVVLAGMNRLSLHLGRRLLAQGVPVFAVDEHPDRVEEFQAAGIQAVLADPSSAGKGCGRPRPRAPARWSRSPGTSAPTWPPHAWGAASSAFPAPSSSPPPSPRSPRPGRRGWRR